MEFIGHGAGRGVAIRTKEWRGDRRACTSITSTNWWRSAASAATASTSGLL